MKCLTCNKTFKKRTMDKRDRNKFCSSVCALDKCRTKEHQRMAGRKGALVVIERYRGKGKKDGYIKENRENQHRVVMQKFLGRKLRKGEIVHHIDHNKKNNNISNLQLMTQSEHAGIHLKDMKRNKLGYLLKIKK